MPAHVLNGDCLLAQLLKRILENLLFAGKN
jgi:hypothetical protein